MTEYSRLAKGNFTATSGSQIVTLPFLPDYVELWNYSIIKTAATHSTARAWFDSKLVDTVASPNTNPTMVEIYAGSSTSTVYDTIQTNGISTFQGALSLQYGAVYQHTGTTDFQISKASAAVVTTTTNHNLQTGDVVVFSNLSQTSTTGMQQIAGIPFTVTRTGATTFTINYNTNQSNFTAFNTATSTNNVGSFKKVLFPVLYLPQDVVITNITTGATTTVSTNIQHNFQVGQEVAFRIPSTWGTTQLNSLPNNVIPGSPIYGFVTSVTDFQNFVVNINSTGFTAFNSNQSFSTFVGQSFAQVVPVGDVNTGGFQITSTSPLFPPPQFSYASKNDSSSINGPTIQGAYFNNTSQGFIIGVGTANVDTTTQIMASGNVIYWHAYAHDFGNP